ncbi:uncharacterized protein [Henckelia pumila]|uniref:uncharacterized protein n=1 Tax=Henckelia pumila TaxID=405737 RepID=UPI003C6E9B10
MSSQDRVRRYTRGRRRKPMLDVDLNLVPQMPCGQEGTSNQASSQDQGNTPLTAAIDLDAYDDDDVIISSPRAFAEAKNNSRRNHGRTVVVDLESEERPSRNKRARFPTSQTICDFYINLEGSSNSNSNSMRNRGQRVSLTPPPPKEPTFSCPVCMGTLVEETSTKCGHIFCKACIKAAIAAQGKCPTCRRKITMKDVIRIYLPATNST